MEGISNQIYHQREFTFSVEKPSNQADEEDTNAFSRQARDEWFLHKAMEQDPRKGCSLLFRRYYAPLCSHAVRYLYSKELAEDLVAQIFCDFWENQLYQQVKVSYRAFLYRMVRNQAIDLLRKDLRRNSQEELDSQPLEAPHMRPEQIMQFDELSAAIESAVEALPTQCRRVFLLSRFEGKKNLEIARQLDISQRTVETHISKALLALRHVVRQAGFVLTGLLMTALFC